MIRRLQFLIPAFLKRIDHYLLLNHPIVWASKVHYVLFYGGLSVLGIGLMSLLPLSHNSRPDVDQQVLLAIIPAAIGLLLWAAQVGKHRAEGLYGSYSLKTRILAQALFMLCLSIFVSLPLIYGQCLAYRAANSVIANQYIASYSPYVPPTYHEQEALQRWPIYPTYHSKWQEQSWKFQLVLPSIDQISEKTVSDKRMTAVTLFAFMVFYGWLFFMLYIRMGWKQFFGFLGIGSICLFLLGAVGGLFAVSSREPIGISLFYVASMILLILPSTNAGGGKQKIYWRKITLSLAVLLTPLAVFFFGVATEFGLVKSILFYVLGGMLLTGFLWNQLYEPIYLAMHSQPDNR
ncbi:MAG: hypothetical protein AAF587_05235 [Bacteroidota bacterium]